MVALSVVNMVTYIPVAVATYALIPNKIKIGQKMLPGPMPQNAEANAPTNAIEVIPIKFFVFAWKSPSTNL